MFCPKCGNQIKDGSKFCAKCGAKIEEQKAGPKNTNVSGAGKTPSPDKKPEKKQRKGGKAILLALLLVLLLAAGVGAAYYVMQVKDVKQQEKEAELKREERRKEKEEKEEKERKEKEADNKAGSRNPAETEAAFGEQTGGLFGGRTTATTETTAAAEQEPFTCSLVYKNQADFSGLYKVNIQKGNVTQSSFVVQKNSNIDNTGWSAFDGQSETSWQEGKSDDGVGEYVMARFDSEYQVKMLTLMLGNHRSNEWFIKNNRPKKLSFSLGSQTIEADFPDEMQEFALVFSQPIPASEITVTIRDVYTGTEYHDTVISEIGVYGN